MNNDYLNDEMEIDLAELMKYILKKMKTIIAMTFVFGIIVLCISMFFLPKSYITTSDISIIPEVQDLDYTSYLTGSTVMDKVSKNLNVDKSVIFDSVTVSRDTNNTYNYNINVVTNNPNLSYSISKNIIKVFKNEMISQLGLSSVTVINKPSMNNEPVSPNIKRNIIISSAIFFIVSLSINILIFLFSKHFKNSAEVEKVLGIRVLGEIPKEK